MTTDLLIFGAGGQFGQELLKLAAARGVSARGLSRTNADITDDDAVVAAIKSASPRLVVNAAAFTGVDKAESEPDAARKGNVDGPATLARQSRAAGIPLLHLSTDYVFDGSKTGAYTEDDRLAPLGVYGQTKADGEDAVRTANDQHVILRTSWVYGPFGANFLKTMLRLAGERDRLRVVADQRGCPTATIDLAEATLAILSAIKAGATEFGTYHFAGSGVTTWHEFAAAIIDAKAAEGGKRPPVDPIATADYPTPARRPANSELDSTRFATAFGYRAAPWQQRTRETVAALAKKA